MIKCTTHDKMYKPQYNENTISNCDSVLFFMFKHCLTTIVAITFLA